MRNLCLFLETTIQFKDVGMVQKALDFNFLCQLLFHLVLCDNLFLYDFKSNHYLRTLILGLKHVTELPSSQKFTYLKPITNCLVSPSQNTSWTWDVLLLWLLGGWFTSVGDSWRCQMSCLWRLLLSEGDGRRGESWFLLSLRRCGGVLLR